MDDAEHLLLGIGRQLNGLTGFPSSRSRKRPAIGVGVGIQLRIVGAGIVLSDVDRAKPELPLRRVPQQLGRLAERSPPEAENDSGSCRSSR